MRKLLNTFYHLYDTNDEFKQRAVSFQRIMTTEDWKFIRDVILTIKGEIMADMLSSRFTNLSAGEKNVDQRSYFNINMILDFSKMPNLAVVKPTKKEKEK
jgi:hypothetical protein